MERAKNTVIRLSTPLTKVSVRLSVAPFVHPQKPINPKRIRVFVLLLLFLRQQPMSLHVQQLDICVY